MDWREPIDVRNIREIGRGMIVDDPSGRLQHATVGEISVARDTWMVKNGQACPECWSTFPAQPKPGNLLAFMPYLDLWAPIPPSLLMERIKAGVCLVCRAPIDPIALERFLMELKEAKAKELVADDQ